MAESPGAESPGTELAPLRGTVATLPPWQRPARIGGPRRRPRRRPSPGRSSLMRWLAAAARRVRYAVGVGVMRASGAPGHDAEGDEPIYARARPQRVRIEERYFYQQDLSQSSGKIVGSARVLAGPPAGQIEVMVPYDGDQCFTRQAYGDVSRACGGSPADAADALIGHLALTDYERTDLDARLDLGATYGSIPLQLPVSPGPDPSLLDHLVADSSACTLTYDYTPGASQLKIVPIDIDVELRDPDSVGFSPPARDAAGTAAGDPAAIMQHVSFRPELLLRMTVRLQVPDRSAGAAPPVVTRLSLSWPAIASLRSLRLRVDGELHPLSYNPEKRGLEWSGVPMTRAADAAEGDLRIYSSPVMELSIPQPGELYGRESLTATAQVRVGWLLSGMSARLYDAAGSLDRDRQPELASLVSGGFALALADALARRMVSPYQQLHFDEVIPDELRISDIKAALSSRGFEVLDPPEQSPERRWLCAERSEGADTLRLDLYIESSYIEGSYIEGSYIESRPSGSRQQRRTRGGETYPAQGESGELRIYVYGLFPRDSQQVVHEVNALRRALRERFDRLPARH
jgi:hypothetical protein